MAKVVKIGNNPLDFLETNSIQNGQYVSIGYLEEATLSKSRRYINAENDKELGDRIAAAKDSRFGRDWANVRNNEKYNKALHGEAKTGSFEGVDAAHILKLGRYNFQWRDAEAKRRNYEEKELPLEQAIRKHYGFTEFEPEDVPEDDWRNKKKVGRDGREKYVYGGAGIYPRVADEDSDKGMGWRPIGGGNADFFEHENTKNISFRQVLGKNNMRSYQFFYANEEDGVLEPFDKDTYYFLLNNFKKEDVVAAGEELLADEQMFIKDMEEKNRRFNHRTFNWEKILYMAASTVGYDPEGNKTFEPFIWINDAVIKETYPWLDSDSLDKLIDESVRISEKDLEEYRKTPEVWESRKSDYAQKLYEGIMRNVSKEVKKTLNEGKYINLDELDEWHDYCWDNYGIIMLGSIDTIFKVIEKNLSKIYSEDGYDWYEGQENGMPVDYAYDDFSAFSEDKEACEKLGHQIMSMVAKWSLDLRNKAYQEGRLN